MALSPWHQREHRHQVHEGDDEAAVGLFANDDVAGQQQADVGLGLQRAVRRRRVAGAEDPVRPPVDTELRFHRGLHVDLGEHAEALVLQRRPRPPVGFLEVHVERPAHRVSVVRHRLFLSHPT